MAFKITIERDRTFTQTTTEWVKLSDKEGPAQYGYGPPIEVERHDSTRIFEQTVEILDLPAVIRAVNGLS
jgi:hypothetical protein